MKKWGLLGVLIVLLLPVWVLAEGPTLSPQSCALQWETPLFMTDGAPVFNLKSFYVLISDVRGAFGPPLTPFATIAVAVPNPVAPAPIVEWDCRALKIPYGQHFLTIRGVDAFGTQGLNATMDAAVTTKYPTATHEGGLPFVSINVPVGAPKLRLP